MKKILVLLPLLAFSGHLHSAPSFSREKIEADLVLKASLSTPTIIEAGGPVALNMALHNTSKTESYRVVKPGDGSEAGWREPHVFYTATLDTGDGKAANVSPLPYGRCGLFDKDWQKDSLILKPGEQLPLEGWLPSPSSMLDFQKAGHVRLYAHYRYSAGHGPREKSPVPDVGSMSGIPAFELVSAPVEFKIIRPLELVLTVKKALKVNTRTKLSDLFDIHLLNQSKEAREFSFPTMSGDTRLFLQSRSKTGEVPSFTLEKSKLSEKQLLQPGRKVNLPEGNGMDGLWTYPVVDTIQVRVGYSRSSPEASSGDLYSEWVEIQAVNGP